jgi:FdhD protein
MAKRAYRQRLLQQSPDLVKLDLESGTTAVDLAVLKPGGSPADGKRVLAIEAPVAIEYNGIGYAVMMATPINLQDFAVGFSLSEQLIKSRADIIDIDVAEVEHGWILRIQIHEDCVQPVIDRARQRVTESSCGLCGLENLEQVVRPLPPITARVTATNAALFQALNDLGEKQPLNRATGAAHGAAFCSNDGTILMVREDVGRHNALDKLIGALSGGGIDPAMGFILLTARCSYELVEKTVTARCPLLVTISAPTTLAVERAKAHNLTLVSLARRDAMLVMAGALGAD